MFGAIYGDVIGSYYETHGTKDYDFPFHPDSSYTDDTVLTVATCQAILHNPHKISKWNTEKRGLEYAAQYRRYYSLHPSAGFGTMFSHWARSEEFSINHSYGNGAAMRAVPIGYAYNSEKQVLLQAKASCYYTHNNREAIKAARAVALAVYLARTGISKEGIKLTLQKKFGYNLECSIDDIRKNYEFDSRASYSVPPAIIAFLESTDYESAIRNAISIGGDADTQACIAGGIAEAFYGEIPENISEFCYNRIDNMMKNVIKEFRAKFCGA
ncbi:MAG: ADP-ribosylglycohydrolase family protein [Ruminococcus sp.]|nr:ADP-ribosylglycohydrolase family protein [Oscillospiraceae bacterium]MBR2724996.1 ADP-ribosylglycohydrolase family protein [Ruminococcus sp.]